MGTLGISESEVDDFLNLLILTFKISSDSNLVNL